MNPRVKEVEYKSQYNLIVTFENNEVKLFNITPYLNYPVFQPLQDEAYCNKAKVINGTVAWDDIIDFDPDTLYLESKTFATTSQKH